MIGIVTGASAGLGKEFARQITKQFPQIDTLWLIARRIGKLEELAEELDVKTVVCVGLDLCNPKSFYQLEQRLKKEKPQIALLVNNAGCGTFGNFDEVSAEGQMRMADLNVRALTLMTHTALPYMVSGGHILNVSSIASFCPNPGMAVYSASKSYVSSFTAALADELRPREISVTAVCPGPMETDFLDAAGITGKSSRFDTLPFCQAQSVAAGALRAARRGRLYYTPKLFYKFYRLAAKLLPVRWMIPAARTQGSSLADGGAEQ